MRRNTQPIAKVAAPSRELPVPHIALFTLLLGVMLFAAACAPYPQRVDQPVVLPNNSNVPQVDAASAAGAAQAEYARLRYSADSVYAAALRGCAPGICDAIGRGEIVLGMTPEQVMAASKTGPQAWIVRRFDGFGTMVPSSPNNSPYDRVGQVMVVQLDRGASAVVSRRGPQGIMVVSNPQDQTTQARARAQAEALVREGDDLVAANDMAGALNRYDRASVLDPDQPEIEYKAARLLDLQLRPQEALMRYQRFLLSMELERIKAQGEANARLAEAIALAQQRIVVLQREVR
jgi:tetratricopeptide (TPR) repeat protein